MTKGAEVIRGTAPDRQSTTSRETVHRRCHRALTSNATVQIEGLAAFRQVSTTALSPPAFHGSAVPARKLGFTVNFLQQIGEAGDFTRRQDR